MRLAASFAKQIRRLVHSSFATTASISEFFDESCDSSSPIRELLDSNVDSKVPTRTFRMDDLLITSMPLMAKDSKSAAD